MTGRAWILGSGEFLKLLSQGRLINEGSYPLAGVALGLKGTLIRP
jgi:hypothetical protein